MRSGVEFPRCVVPAAATPAWVRVAGVVAVIAPLAGGRPGSGAQSKR